MNNKKIESLGLISDKMFFDFDNSTIERDDYFVLLTLDNPDFFWGNYLMFKNGPKEGDFTKWQKIFEEEFLSNPKVLHKTFSWAGQYDGEELKKFIDSGYDFSDTLVLVCESSNLNCVYENKEIQCSVVANDDDWNALVEFQVETNSDFNPKVFREFITKRILKYRSYVNSGHGNWYIAKIGNRIVADLGLFGTGTLARFQNIKTHFDFRKRGISQTLINYAAKNSGKDFFVIEADEDGPAINMYKSIGFSLKENIYGLCFYDKNKWDK